MKTRLELFGSVRCGNGAIDYQKEIDLDFVPYPGMVLCFRTDLNSEDVNVRLADSHERTTPSYMHDDKKWSSECYILDTDDGSIDMSINVFFEGEPTLTRRWLESAGFKVSVDKEAVDYAKKMQEMMKPAKENLK